MASNDFPNVMAWLQTMGERPAVQRAIAVGQDIRAKSDISKDKQAQSVLFNQRAR